MGIQFMYRRTSARLWTCGIFIALIQSLFVARGAIPATNGWPEVKVIDVHTHVFNARDLPLTGALNAFGLPRPVAVVVSEAVLAATPEDDDPREARVNLTSVLDQVERPSFREPLTELQRHILLDYVGTNRWAPLQEAARYLKVSGDVTLVAETIARVGFPEKSNVEEASWRQPPTLAKELGDKLKGYVRFIGLMMKKHIEIEKVLEHDYPETDLYVHHMMDMEVAYADSPMVYFPDQIKAMQRLDEAAMGRFMHFVAFDPFRRNAALPWASRAISSNAAVGFKIYPPTGYRAALNDTYGFPPKPNLWDVWARQRWNSRYDGWNEANLDATLQRGFEWAASKDVPLFTHCTPNGFEAAAGYGWMADPFFWAAALERNKAIGDGGLRLCFGHSGGEAYWFSDPTNDFTHTHQPPFQDAWLFGNQVVKLCLKYPKVYCEVGYLDPILDPKKADVLVRRLDAVLDVKSDDGTWCFGDKLMFGTDWHMIYKEPDYEKYLKAWDAVIKRVGNGKGTWRSAFFARNAKKFLKLDELAKDSRFTADERNAWANLSATIK